MALPPSGRNTLPGNRVESKRAGMTPTMRSEFLETVIGVLACPGRELSPDFSPASQRRRRDRFYPRASALGNQAFASKPRQPFDFAHGPELVEGGQKNTIPADCRSRISVDPPGLLRLSSGFPAPTCR